MQLVNSIRILVFVVCVFNISNTIFAQENSYAQALINKLSSEKMQGRGYVKGGDKKAAIFLRNEFKNMKAIPLGNRYFQDFSFAMNTFPGIMEVRINDCLLRPVYDYVVAPESKGLKGEFKLHYITKAADSVDAIFDSICKIDYTGKFVVADLPNRKIIRNNPFNASGVIVPQKKVFWWASTGHFEARVPVFTVLDSILEKRPEKISVNFSNRFKNQHNTQNLAAFFEGSEQPDSFIVFAAHYDHLGIMGKGNVFRGANDNASGVSMVLCLAKYFSKKGNKPNCSIAFLLFAGEESGLMGSKYFVDNPLFPLAHIKALINLDMVGSGSDGISIVNGRVEPKITQTLQQINSEHNYFTDIRVGKESCNSDHCFFSKAGVPSVFIFTRGKECTAYHNLEDTPDKTPLTKFNELQQMLIEFAK